jgi:hypothetical protein
MYEYLPKIDKPKFPLRLYYSFYSLNKSLAELESMYRFGSLTELEYRWRVLFWSWSAVRLTGKAGRLQDRCYDAFGLVGVDKRIERAKKLREQYIRKYYGEWLID